MNIHSNARLTPRGREHLVSLVEAGLRYADVARSCGVSERSVGKWVRRMRSEGLAGLQDRSSRPRRVRPGIGAPTRERICALRRKRLSGTQICRATGVSAATISRVLRRAGLSRLEDLQRTEPPRRYVYARPGGMVHLDIKKLGRFYHAGHRVTGTKAGRSNQAGSGPGWEALHVCIDDASRTAFTRIAPDETASSAVSFLHAAVAWYARQGVRVDRVMTDNGACYVSRAFRQACADLGLRHIRTRPYTPRTNGKAERFIRTALAEWAYARVWRTSEHRAAALPRWTWRYNARRSHSGINGKTPLNALCEMRNNL